MPLFCSEKLFTLKTMQMSEKILVTICARGGSKGVKGKNFRLLNGRPLIYYTIQHALLWEKTSRIVVSTDSQEIAKIAQKYGVRPPFTRPEKLATDTSGKIAVIRHALMESERIYRERYDIILDLDVTAPMRKLNDMDRALELFLEKRPKTLFSVVEAHKNPYFNVVEVDKRGRAHLCKNTDTVPLRRQDAPTVFNINGSIIFFSRKFLMDKSNKSALSDDSIIYLMENIHGIDIDREIDFHFIEFLIKEGIIVN